MLNILSYVSGPSVCPPWRSVCSGPFPIFNWIVCVPGQMSFLYDIFLDIKPLSNVSLANMSSHIVDSLFILMMVSLTVQKLFNLM